MPRSSQPAFRLGFGRPHQMSKTSYACPAWPVSPLLDTYYSGVIRNTPVE